MTKLAGLLVLRSHLAHRCQRKWGKEGRAVMGCPQEGEPKVSFCDLRKTSLGGERDREKKHLCPGSTWLKKEE